MTTQPVQDPTHQVQDDRDRVKHIGRPSMYPIAYCGYRGRHAAQPITPDDVYCVVCLELCKPETRKKILG